VICQNSDLICTSCISLFETLDRLEHEVIDTREAILRILYKKYELDIDFSQDEKSHSDLKVSPLEEPPKLDTFAVRKLYS